ncbi:hypothetical protein UPYG_G00116680 [Umbra pygmaea]|uniref:RRM domain-containing protein n=1 Tax=Umbra pygmaea TaxID=75934 RepID=A0ABD0X805_UMBPY
MQNQNEANKTVFVANLSSSANEEILFELFLQAGPLKKVTIPRDREGHQRSYGFVYYKHAEAVPYAIALLNGTWLFGRQIRLQYSTGSSHQDGGPGPQGGEDESDDPSHGTPSLKVIGVPESSVFHFTGCSDNVHLGQDRFCWNDMVRGFPPEHYPLSIIPTQPHYFAPASPLWPPVAPLLPWLMPGNPRWTPPQTLCPSQAQASLHQPPLHSTQPDEQTAPRREGPEKKQKAKRDDVEPAKLHICRRSRERRHRLQRHKSRCKKGYKQQ